MVNLCVECLSIVWNKLSHPGNCRRRSLRYCRSMYYKQTNRKVNISLRRECVNRDRRERSKYQTFICGHRFPNSPCNVAVLSNQCVYNRQPNTQPSYSLKSNLLLWLLLVVCRRIQAHAHRFPGRFTNMPTHKTNNNNYLLLFVVWLSCIILCTSFCAVWKYI